MSAKSDTPLAECAPPALDASRDAFFFDVDGTLLNIAPKPEQVTVPDTLKDSLQKLRARCGGAVALVSGRTLDVVDALFAPLKLAAAGCHGAEMRFTPDGPRMEFGRPVPSAIRHAFAGLGMIDRRIVVEDKIYSLAFHYRTAVDREAELLALAQERLKPFAPEFIMIHGKAIVEIKSATFDKGKALERLLAIPPFQGRDPIFCGDDTTDEDAFRALPAYNGVGISVGHRMAGAQFMFPNPHSVRKWIAHLAEGGRS